MKAVACLFASSSGHLSLECSLCFANTPRYMARDGSAMRYAGMLSHLSLHASRYPVSLLFLLFRSFVPYFFCALCFGVVVCGFGSGQWVRNKLALTRSAL
ncbi:hypothetical protein IF2G_07606 [Cordyceps javanica]|nr:hypothetical protein IF2G_07606 [Cordyceps javanica]